ncbi:MAG: hypothetical protein HRU29_10320 [Rhizobiales bacterium]|nr:hypothetical protein [Hyphomicrobiales bacterium]NRB14785.1 hypothetical protein [Hyphomicrobiales bacterium]
MSKRLQNAQSVTPRVMYFYSVIRPLSLFAISLVAGLYMHWAFYIAAFILLLDVQARLTDYIRFRHIPYNVKILNLLEKSWCKRGVAQAIWPEAVAYYRTKGHKFYHIMPVGAPRVFFKLRFWEAVIGTKTPKDLI